MKLSSVLCATLISLVCAQVHAEVVKRQMPACVSEDALNEAFQYAAKSDQRGLAQLLTSGQCTILPSGANVSVIDGGILKATIRYKGLKLYTPSEAIR